MNDKQKNKGFDFVQTSPCGRGQHHPRGLVGKIWRIKNPKTINMGNCFLSGRLKEGDLFLCIEHAGDYCQNYIYIRKRTNLYHSEFLESFPNWVFGSYGIGDAENTDIELSENDFETLKSESSIINILNKDPVDKPLSYLLRVEEY